MVNHKVIKISIIIGYILLLIGVFYIEYASDTVKLIIRIWGLSINIFAFTYFISSENKKKNVKNQKSKDTDNENTPK